METTHIMNAWGYRPWLNDFNFAFIHLDPLGRDNIAQKHDLLSEKWALLQVTIELFHLKDLYDLGEMYKMLFFTLTINQDVIKVNHHKVTNKRLNTWFISLRKVLGVWESKGHNQPLTLSPFGLECGFPLIPFPNPNLVGPTS